MNIKRFTARTSREALRLVREALGDDAVVLSTKPAATGIEVMAMAPDAIGQFEHTAAASALPTAPRGVSRATSASAPTAPVDASSDLGSTDAADDAERLSMSTLSFQDYVRRRMLKRRDKALKRDTAAPTPPRVGSSIDVRIDDDITTALADVGVDLSASDAGAASMPMTTGAKTASMATAAAISAAPSASIAHPPIAGTAGTAPTVAVPALATMAAEAPTANPFDLLDAAAVDSLAADSPYAPRGAAIDGDREHALLSELRAVKDLIEERFGALAFMEKMQRRPAEARLAQKLLDCGFSPVLVKKIGQAYRPEIEDETAWVAQVLERNLRTAAAGEAIEERGGIFALIGATGVGKTTTTAKIAAAFAARHGASQLGLITLDAYRVGAHEQLRAYGRILGVPVHTAHDRASLEDLLDLLTGKKLVLIDTAGMAQRDSRTRELLDMLSHKSIRRLLVVNAASQGETIEDVLVAYRAQGCVGMAISKLDEAVKLGPVLDAAIRHKLQVVGVANGQRVPEDWHRLSAHALVQRALKSAGSSAWRLDESDLNLVFAGPIGVDAATPAARAAAAV